MTTKNFGHLILFRCCCFTLLGTLLLSGCAPSSNARRGGAQDAGLYAWIEEELSPYLVDELSQQPRFKGEAVMLVAMQDAQPRVEKDGLTSEIHSRVMGALLGTPGINLVSPVAPTGTTLTGRAQRQACERPSTAQYLVGIDIGVTPSGLARLDIRAMDVLSGQWVTGFGRHWQGRLGQKQLRAYNTLEVEPPQSGHRELPFHGSEMDLLAAYLAAKIRCSLNDQIVFGEVAIQSAETDQPQISQVLDLVAHNLSRQSWPNTVRSRAVESVLLSGNLNRIDGELHQLWVTVTKKDSSDKKFSLVADAYLSLSVGSPLIEKTPLDVTDPVRHVDMDTAFVPGADIGPPTGVVMTQPKLLSDRVVGDCGIESYDNNHYKENWYVQDCFDLEFELLQPAYVLLVRHEVNGLLSRVPVEGCDAVVTDALLRFPASSMRIAGLRFRETEWVTRDAVYTVAVRDKRIARKLANHVARLPDDCQEQNRLPAIEDDLDWLEQFQAMVEQHPDEIEWRSVEIRL